SQLHPGREFVAGDPRIELALAGPSTAMQPIQAADPVPLDQGDLVWLIVFAIEIQDGRSGRLEPGPLVDRGKKSGSPTLCAVDRQAQRGVHDDVERQLITFPAEHTG